MSAERIEAALRGGGRDGAPALVAFLTAGHPAVERWEETLVRVAEAADVVEIGVPFSDPMADGVTIQRSSREALAAGVSVPWILERVKNVRARVAAPLLLMSYLNPLLRFGVDELARAAVASGVDGFIVPDLPLEEGALARPLVEAGLGVVQLVTPVTPRERALSLARASGGFLYAVTQTGTTGRRAELGGSATRALDVLRAVSPVPVCAGFGIRSAAQVAALAPHVDGVIVGSALVEVLERGEDPAAFLRGLRPAAVEGER
jgi:tryptophan synthase alpha chain